MNSPNCGEAYTETARHGDVVCQQVPAQACLPGVSQHKKEMDHALGELVLSRAATMYKVRGSI